MANPDTLAERAIQRLVADGLSIGVAESVTGGLVTAALVGVPGASTVLRGGIIAYATELKAELLDVPRSLLASRGPACAEVADAMSVGVARRMRANVGLAVTGVAGPTGQGASPVGSVHVACWIADSQRRQVRTYGFDGDRAEIRRLATEACLGVLVETIGE